MSPAPEKPSLDVRLRTIRGEDTGWTFSMHVPPVCTLYWGEADWLRWVGTDHWRRVQGHTPLPSVLPS